MQRTASLPAPRPLIVPGPAPRTDAPRIAVAEAVLGARPPLLDRAGRVARRARLTFAAAGLLFGLASASVYILVEDLSWTPLRTLVLVLVLPPLVVPSVVAQGVAFPRVKAGLYLGYLRLVLALLTVGGTPVLKSLLLLLIVVLLPVVFVVATVVPSLRGAAWLVAPALAVLGLAAVALVPAGLFLYVGAPFTGVVWSLVAFAVSLPFLVVGYGVAVSALHARKWTSDQTLLVLQWWLVLALWHALLVGPIGPGPAALALVPFLVLVLFLAGVASLAPRTPSQPPVRLLLLRTFGARRRSSRLLRDVTAQWRWVGSVELITGTGVATEVLEPHEFLDFLRRRLSRSFVADAAQVSQRVRDLDLRVDRDGRFRVNDLLCHGDTWQPTVQALVGSVDAVLLDLRGLRSRNLGVLAEIECLVARLLLERVVALVDETTDLDVLHEALATAAAAAPASASPHGQDRPELRVVRLTGRRRSHVVRVLSAVAEAAGAST